MASYNTKEGINEIRAFSPHSFSLPVLAAFITWLTTIFLTFILISKQTETNSLFLFSTTLIVIATPWLIPHTRKTLTQAKQFVVQANQERLKIEVDKTKRQIQKLDKEQAQSMIRIAHKLQTPLTILRGEIDLIKKPNNQKTLDYWEKTINQTSKFISDYLSLTKIETETLELEKINISKLLNNFIEYFTTIAEERNITIHADIEKNICINGNKNRLEELITQLASNAFKHVSNEKKICFVLKKKRNKTTFTISNTGKGISRKNIKDTFSKAHLNTTSISKLPKLGLVTCRQIVENHNAVLNINSNPRKGTTFQVNFS